MPKIKQALKQSREFCDYFAAINPDNQNITNKKDLKFSDVTVYKIVNHGGFADFKTFKENYAFNHKITHVEWLSDREDTGCLHVVDDGGNHNFALEAGVYVKNSRPDGRGSKVETLPGGQGLGELADLEYFQWKVFRGLRIPLSYMREGTDGAQINDGKVGTAYIQELRFAMYIKRLQGYISRVIDKEFKRYLRRTGINVDPAIFNISLLEPENFGVYRQQELDNSLLTTFQSASGITFLSPRFTMKKYLQLTDEEILSNERLKREELGLDPNGGVEDLIQIYGPPPEEGGMAAGGGMMAGIPGMGMGMGADVGVDGVETGMDGAAPGPETAGAPPV